jgi:hypothetical protein
MGRKQKAVPTIGSKVEFIYLFIYRFFSVFGSSLTGEDAYLIAINDDRIGWIVNFLQDYCHIWRPKYSMEVKIWRNSLIFTPKMVNKTSNT